jgi:Ni/Co efflux regulator RcnB
MKKLVVMAVACLMAATSYAAQDEGKAKQNTERKLKDDGTCWAVTEAGTRCKHKKDGESDYCKQHAPSKKPAKPFTQCRALTYGGKQCERKPVEGGRYCPQHNK